MFDKLKNLFKPQQEKQVDLQFFIKNETSANLSAEKQFLVSLSQIIGEHHEFYTNSLTAGTNTGHYLDILHKWYNITDTETAKQFIESRLAEGFRTYYNEIAAQYTATNGNAAGMSVDDDVQEEFQDYFTNIKEVLALREGQFWFTNNLGSTDAFDFGRLAFVIRSAYTVGFLPEEESWDYLYEIGKLASEKFSTWNDYAKSYMLGRAIWSGADGSFENFSEVTRYLVSSPNSPWMQPFLKI